MSADLLVIVPTRNRPQNARALYESWEATVTGRADLLFVCDDDDPQLDSYKNQMSWMPLAQLEVGSRLRMVGSLNRAAVAHADEYKYLGFFGDDHRPRVNGWVEKFCETLSKSPASVVYGNDLLQGEKMATAVAMTSDIVRALGYMAPPSMVHLCVDLVWNLWGERLGTLAYLDDVVIEHMHPANGKALNDLGYIEVNSSDMMKRDSEAYFAYRDGGQLDMDIEELKKLL
jgi:hypothetical protein